MPYISRPNPSFLYDPTRIIWLDASQSNTIITSYPSYTYISQWNDAGNFGNNVTANGAVQFNSVSGLSNSVSVLSGGGYLYNSDTIIKSFQARV